MTTDLDRQLTVLPPAADHDPGVTEIRRRAIARRDRARRRRSSAGLAAVAVVVAAVAALTATGPDPDGPPTTELPRIQVEHLRTTGTTGLVRTYGLGLGFQEDAIGRLTTDDGTVQLVAGTVWPGNDVPAKWSGDDGLTWQPVELPAGAAVDQSSTTVFVSDTLAVIISGSTVWTSDDAARPFVEATVTGDVPGTADQPGTLAMQVFGFAPGSTEGAHVMFGRVGDTAVRFVSNDGRDWSVEPVEFLGTVADPYALDRVVAVGDRYVVASSQVLASDDGGRTWAHLVVPELEVGPGTRQFLHVVDGTAYLSNAEQTWSSVDGVTWTPLITPPLPAPPDGMVGEMGVTILAADGDRMASKTGTDIGAAYGRADLWWSDDGGATWRPSDGVRQCPVLDDGDVHGWVTGATELGDGSLLVTWACNGEVRVLRTTDVGRTWTTVSGSVSGGVWSAPIPVEGGAAVVIGGAGADQPSAPYLRIEPVGD
ncbi:MAG: exo-alpha-sialidase [Actinobacteria bacterium]|nr:exo-alpha-sialidase [Actinomycetota bacterium]